MVKNVLAIDVGGSKISYGIISPEGKILENNRVELASWNADEVIRQVKFLIKSYQPKVGAVGIGFPGIVNTQTGEIVYDEKSQKYTVDWDSNIPVAIENDANLAAMGEKWLGAAQEINNFIFIILGDGIGSGIYLEGHLYRGSHYSSGEIREVVTSNKELNCVSGHNYPGEFSANDRGSLNFICDQLAQGIQSIAAVIDPTAIIFGGSRGIHLWPLIENDLQEKLRHLNILIQASSLGFDAGLLGAAKLALDMLEEKNKKPILNKKD